MERELIIKKIFTKISNELTYEKVCTPLLDEYRDTIFRLFRFINQYKDKYQLNCYDFRDFLNEFYYHLDLKSDWEENRYTLIIDELANYYTNEPYYWNSPFEIYLIKLEKILSFQT